MKPNLLAFDHFNYNLPPEIQFLLCYILCVGVIPSPRKPKDADSFAYSLILELLKFLAGISTFDVKQNELFALRAYLVAVFGDILAISMIMRMKGHNAIFPCRMCLIKGIRVPDTRNTTHYIPLYRANHPTVLVPGDNPKIAVYASSNLPLRTHEEFLDQAHHVQFAPTSAEEHVVQRHVESREYLSSLTCPHFSFHHHSRLTSWISFGKTCSWTWYCSGLANSKAWTRGVSLTNLVLVSGKQSEKQWRRQVPQFHLHMPPLVLKMWPKIPQLAQWILGPSRPSILGLCFSGVASKRLFIISISSSSSSFSTSAFSLRWQKRS